MKKISEKDIEAIINTVYQLNAPVQVYVGIKDLLSKLPDVESPKEESK